MVCSDSDHLSEPSPILISKSKIVSAIKIRDTPEFDLTAPSKLKRMPRKANSIHRMGHLTQAAIPQLKLEEDKMIPQSAHKMTSVEYATDAIEEELHEDVTAEPPE